MPTVLSHPAVPVALACALGTGWISPRLLLAGVLASVLPDLDVLGYHAGVPYADAWGHRGASHSLALALLVGCVAALLAPRLHARRGVAAVFLALCCASHGLLDMATNGGLGVAFLWPLDGERFFFTHHPIRVSPLSLQRFFGPAGQAVLLSELRWVWLPALGLGLLGWVGRRFGRRR